MNKNGIQIIKWFSGFKTRFKWKFIFIAMIEIGRESTEKLSHGNIHFSVAIINGGIVYTGFVIFGEHIIPAPKIAMKKRRFFDRKNTSQIFVQTFNLTQNGSCQFPGFHAHFNLRLYTFYGKKVEPVGMPVIGLGQSSNIIIE